MIRIAKIITEIIKDRVLVLVCSSRLSLSLCSSFVFVIGALFSGIGSGLSIGGKDGVSTIVDGSGAGSITLGASITGSDFTSGIGFMIGLGAGVGIAGSITLGAGVGSVFPVFHLESLS